MRYIKRIPIEIIRWMYWFPFRMLIQRLPLKVGLLPAYPAALLAYMFKSKQRKLTEEGLDKMFEGRISKRQRKLLVFKTFDNSVKKGIEAFWYPKLTATLCDKIIVYEGLKYLDDALLEGRGVVLLHGHLGNAHMLMPALGFKGYRLSQLGSRNPPVKKMGGLFCHLVNNMEQRIYEIKLSYKEALPVNFIYTDKSPRELFTRLKTNEIIAIAIDGREGQKWIEVDFLGQKALFATGVMNLINKMNPVVLPTFVVRQDNNTHKIIIAEPMELKDTGDKKRDIMENTKSFLNLLEKYVITYPYLYGDAFWLGESFFKKNLN